MGSLRWPILGLILTGAALGGASVHTTLRLLAYAAGAATSLTVALLARGRVFAPMNCSLGADEWIRRILAVLAGVVAVAFWPRPRRPDSIVAIQYGKSGAETC